MECVKSQSESGADSGSRSRQTGASAAAGSRSRSPDVAKAAVWAYEYGYLRILLRGKPLSQRLSQPAGEQLPICQQLLLLCPLDGQLPDNIDQLDESKLKSVGRAQSFTQSVAGAQSREYGGHSVYRLTGASESRLVAVEPVASLRTLRVVAAAMARCDRAMPRLDERQLISDFVQLLSDTVSRDAQLRDLVRLVVYEPGQDGGLLAALSGAAFSDVPVDTGRPLSASSPPLPGGVGVYLAWSFFHGYLEMVSGRRDVASELSELERHAALSLPLKRIAVLCPTTPGWTEAADADDISSLDAQLKPVQDVAGVGVAEPALAGRKYGNFSIYRSARGGSCFALELATPLRTLSMGVASEGHDPEVYRREASSFADELDTLLAENPTVSAHFVVIRVQQDTKVDEEITALATTTSGHLFRSPHAEQQKRGFCVLI